MIPGAIENQCYTSPPTPPLLKYKERAAGIKCQRVAPMDDLEFTYQPNLGFEGLPPEAG